MTSESWEQKNLVNTRSFKEFYRDFYASSRVYLEMQRAGQTPVRRFTPLTKTADQLKEEVATMIDSVWDDWSRIFNTPSLVRSRAVERMVEPVIKWKFAPTVLTGWKIGVFHSKELASQEEAVMKDRQQEASDKEAGAR